MIRKLQRAATFILIGLGFTMTANAGLLNDTVTIQYVGDNSSSSLNTHVVGAGEEGNFFSNQFYDFDDFSFTIRSIANYCGIFSCGTDSIALVLDDLDFGADLTAVTFTTNLTGVSASFDADTVSFQWIEQDINTGTYLTASFDIGEQVPEPTTLAIMGLGLVGIGWKRRKAA